VFFFPPTICIDPGHPSEVGRGTQGRHITEIAVAWEVAQELRTDLKKLGFQVVMTKSSENQFVRNRKRAETANSAQAVLMVRLHCDSSSGTGFTTYYPDQQGVSGGVRGPSQTLLDRTRPIAAVFHTTLARDLQGVLQDNGLKGDEATAVGRKQGALTGSVFSKVPVVLVEMVVLTNPKDEAFVLKPANRAKLAAALADATKAAVSAR
jgi:N-acetylmuramoyl-L-alanine amidase